MISTGWIEASSLFATAGMTVIHFLWQGAVIALATAIALEMTGSARKRYAITIAAMSAMLATPAITFFALLRNLPGSADASAGSSILTESTGVYSLSQFAEPLLPWIALFWLAGAATLQVRLLVQWVVVQRIRRTAQRDAPESWRSMVDEICSRMKIGPVVRIAESHLVTVPSVAGSLKPIILMPAGVMKALTPAMLRGVIAHELAHIRRHDYAANLVQNILESLLFFHPAVWWLSHRIRVEREFCCDDLALATCCGRVEYARALHELEQFRFHNRQFVPAFTGGSLMDRIARIAGTGCASGRRVAHGAWLAPLVALLLVGTAWSAVQYGPGDVHLEHPDLLLPDVLELKEDMFLLQKDLHGLDLFELEDLEELEDLKGLQFELQEDLADLQTDLQSSHRVLIPRMPNIRLPRGLTVLGDGHHFMNEREYRHLEQMEESRENLHQESLSIVEDLVDGDISSKEAVKKMEELVKEFRKSEEDADKIRKETMLERAEAEYEAELKIRKQMEEKEAERKARRKDRDK